MNSVKFGRIKTTRKKAYANTFLNKAKPINSSHVIEWPKCAVVVVAFFRGAEAIAKER